MLRSNPIVLYQEKIKKIYSTLSFIIDSINNNKHKISSKTKFKFLIKINNDTNFTDRFIN
jgi:hypothetical protein